MVTISTQELFDRMDRGESMFDAAFSLVLGLSDQSEPANSKIDFEAHWMTWFRRLKIFYKKNGHCSVPQQYIDDDGNKLGLWVGGQRAAYRARMEGKTSPLTLDRLQLLESIGFVWSCRSRNNHDWTTVFESLKSYHKANGHTNVPNKYVDDEGIKLGIWVRNQRHAHKLMKEGKKSSMNEERAKLLESVGFKWRLR